MANPVQLPGLTTPSGLDPKVPQIPRGANSQQAAFIRTIWPYVVAQSNRTGIPVEVFIVQSGVETGWGTSWLFRVAHNPAGVGAFDASHGNQFPDLATGFSTYADRLMGRGEGGQAQFIADVQHGASAEALLTDLQNGPWAGGHYNHSSLVAGLHGLYGGSGSTAFPGTGGPGTSSSSSSDSGQNAALTAWYDSPAFALSPLGTILSQIPGFDIKKAVLSATPGGALILTLMNNWQFWLEAILGVTAILVGGFIILADTKVVRTTGTAAAGAAALAA